jgi:PTS system mannose-specific IIC component
VARRRAMSELQLILALSLLAGALALDATAVLQLMLSQPVVAGTLAGLIVGEPALGLAIGAVLQLVWLGSLPVGAASFPDASSGAVVAVGTATMLQHVGAGAGLAAAVGIVLGLLTGGLGQRVTRWVRRTNEALATFAEAGAGVGSARNVAQAVALGLAARFVSAALLSAGALSVGMIVSASVGGRGVGQEFQTLLWAAPVAAAVVAAGGRAKGEAVFLAGGFLVGLILTVWR